MIKLIISFGKIFSSTSGCDFLSVFTANIWTFLSSKIDTLITIARALQNRKEATVEDSDTIEGIPFNFSCPFDAKGDEIKSDIATNTEFGNSGLVLPINSKLGKLTPDELIKAINQQDDSDTSNN